MIYLGNFAEDATVHVMFNTFTSDDPSASVTITDFVNTDVHIHKDAGLTQRNNAAGITVSVDFDGITGSHMIVIDTSDDTVGGFWVTGSDYFVRIEGTTVDGATINAMVAQFSIENRYNEIVDYDPPTKTEMDTAHALLATEAKQDTIDGIVDDIVADTNELQTDDIPGALATHDGKLDTVDGIVDDILVDTAEIGGAVGASISADVAAVKAETALIVADTNELQTDDMPGALSTHDGKLDTVDGIVDDILVDTAEIGGAVGASISADVAAVKAETALIVADTNELQTDDIPGALSTHDGKLDTVDGIVDDILTDTGTTLDALIKDVPTVAEFEARSDVAGTAATPAEVNSEVLDVMNVDTFAEPGQGNPGATISIFAKINYLFKAWRNKKVTDSAGIEIYNDAGAVVDQKLAHSDDGTDYEKGEVVTGP